MKWGMQSLIKDKLQGELLSFLEEEYDGEDDHAVIKDLSPTEPLNRDSRASKALGLVACMNGSEDIKTLINLRDSDNATFLYKACCYGKPIMAGLLIEAGADINLANIRGNTPLHVACMNGEAEIVKLLLSKGADWEIRNEKGLSPAEEVAALASNEEEELDRQRYINVLKIISEHIDEISKYKVREALLQEELGNVSVMDAPKSPGGIKSPEFPQRLKEAAAKITNAEEEKFFDNLNDGNIKKLDDKGLVNTIKKASFIINDKKALEVVRKIPTSDKTQGFEGGLQRAVENLKARISANSDNAYWLELIKSVVQEDLKELNSRKFNEPHEGEKAAKDRKRIKDFDRYMYKELELEEAREDYIKHQNLALFKDKLVKNTASLDESSDLEAIKEVLSNPNISEYINNNASLKSGFNDFLKVYEPIFNNLSKDTPLYDQLFEVASYLRIYEVEKFNLKDPSHIRFIENNEPIKEKFDKLFSSYEDMFDKFDAAASFGDKVSAVFSKVEHKKGSSRAPENIENPVDSPRLNGFFSWYGDIFGKLDATASFDDKLTQISTKLEAIDRDEESRKQIKQYLTNLQRNPEQDRGLWDKIKHFPLNLRSSRILNGKKEDNRLLDHLTALHRNLEIESIGTLLNGVESIERDGNNKKKDITPLLMTALRDTFETLKKETLTDGLDHIYAETDARFKQWMQQEKSEFNNLMLNEVIGGALGRLKKVDMFVKSYQDSADYDNSQSAEAATSMRKDIDEDVKNLSTLVKALYVGEQNNLEKDINSKMTDLSYKYDLKKEGVYEGHDMNKEGLSQELEAILGKRLGIFGCASPHSAATVEERPPQPSTKKKQTVRLADKVDIYEDEPVTTEGSLVHGNPKRPASDQPMVRGDDLSSKDDHLPLHPAYDQDHAQANKNVTDGNLKDWGKKLLSNPAALLLFAFFVLFAPMVVVIPTLVAMGLEMRLKQQHKLSALRNEIKDLKTVNREIMHDFTQNLQNNDIFTPNNPFQELNVNNISDADFDKVSDAAKIYRHGGVPPLNQGAGRERGNAIGG